MIDVSDIVFTRCKYELTRKYGNKGITVGSSKARIPERYPAALIVQIGSPSYGSSFANTQLAVISTFEVHTYAKDALIAKEIMQIIADTLSTMNYALIFGAEDISTDVDVTQYVARFRRTIGAGDEINII